MSVCGGQRCSPRILHRASPLCSAIPHSSSRWTACHFSLQRSPHFLKAQRGVAEQSNPPHTHTHTFIFLPPSSVKSLGSSPSWADSTILQGSESFPALFIFFSQPFFRGLQTKKESTPATIHVRQNRNVMQQRESVLKNETNLQNIICYCKQIP